MRMTDSVLSFRYSITVQNITGFSGLLLHRTDHITQIYVHRYYPIDNFPFPDFIPPTYLSVVAYQTITHRLCWIASITFRPFLGTLVIWHWLHHTMMDSMTQVTALKQSFQTHVLLIHTISSLTLQCIPSLKEKWGWTGKKGRHRRIWNTKTGAKLLSEINGKNLGY